MSRGRLTTDELRTIDTQLPDTLTFQRETLELSPDAISVNAPKDSEIPKAAVCFMDLGGTLCAVRHALHECLACGLWYRQQDPPNEEGAIFMECYYLDDAALRLYSAGEHLANAIAFMLEIRDEDLRSYKKRRVSQQSVVGTYLSKKRPEEKVTKALVSLADSQEWNATTEYRNAWVHQQPPTVEGLGIQYRRKVRWERCEDGKGWKHPIGGGDPTQYTIDEIKGFIFPATQQLLDASWVCLEHYYAVLEALGVSRLDDGSGMQVDLR
jgi:hypothetical protein